MKSISRRQFSSGLAAGTAGILLGCRADPRDSAADHRTQLTQNQLATDVSIQRYTNMGNTGLTVSDIIFGAGIVNEPGLVRYAFDLGVNVFDTAATYGGGISEETIAAGLQGIRDRVHIITKQGADNPRRINRRRIERILERSLRRLQTDYVDGLFIHSMDSMDPLNQDEIVESFVRFKQEGKVLFTGFSTHNERLTLSRCLDPRYEEFVDAVMFRYNHVESEAIEPLISRMRDRRIGTIAMKTLAGGNRAGLGRYVRDGLTYSQAAIAWVLANKNIDCAVMSMDTFSLIHEYVGASGIQLQRSS
jgi:aryl-alcohol dehydrogenase-like predicted oxidoreductase